MLRRTQDRLLLILVTGAAALSALPSCSSGSATPSPAPPPCVIPDTGLPSDVFCTGLYDNRDAAQISPTVMAYTPGVVLWSDGAEKRRYLYLPPGTTIDTSSMDAWVFPVGTKVWKEFVVDGVLVETRLLWKRDPMTWAVGTYVWDHPSASAALDTDPKGIILPSGYEIPTLKDCDKCHHGGSDKVLGVEAVALSLPTAQGATLSVLAQKGFLSAPPAVTTATLPADATGKSGDAMGYLHANCGMPCHSTRGLGDETKLVLRLRAGEVLGDGAGGPPVDATLTDLFLATVNKLPTTASAAQAFPGAKRIVPGAHDQSLLWKVAHLRGNYQMPPLVSHRIDDAGTQLLADWIDALPP